ncbi:ABC transporter permease subunit [Rhizobium leguminosarum]|uniref:amino acid ABC transporter permease n=1 Tax=Rhizobium leguminosarum TaxID=384 RepID=UPI0017AAE3A1|nr:ABC transporter permease subunit [Rhizobium leguminosarum]MBB4434236.1 general L-amino acid transport system permease protein [Rhizobium esperanzae]MBB4309827.1 general L-amino acid transport system permease protein [Rhizobium leguminosarum]MBB4419433.1 general L-amino acid transport system permease protein [Rhizobium leguminosarum]MBB4530985.1 general L-amino acid transport system permease protein [Rhizobium leguminosarum]MBB4543777.1 general L-amino acid transport system permease protein 
MPQQTLNDRSEPGFSKPGFPASVRRWLGPAPFFQTVFLLLLAVVLWRLGSNVVETMQRLGLNPGFAFLHQRANFEIGESLIAYSSSDTYGRALLAGLVNTINVAFFGCVLATILGILLGIARLSGNLVLSSFVRSYVEVFRNTPLLLQLFLWSAIFHSLPAPRRAITLSESLFLSNRGVFLPRLLFDGPSPLIWLPPALIAAGIAISISRRWFFGQRLYASRMTAVAVAVFVAVPWAAGVSVSIELPVRGGFNISGGVSLTPEIATLLAGLIFNSAATIAEIVRSGIQSVGNGQWEAARALGLRPGHIMRLIVLPQALRVITPLMTSSYLDLTKNSSLAVAIGFPDLVSVANTTANTTGQTLEAITIIAVAYLTLNLGVSALMNIYNRRIMLRDARRR